MKGKSLLLASVLALAAPVAQADHDGKTYTIYFEKSTLVFQCRDKKVLVDIFKGLTTATMVNGVKQRVAVLRQQILPNGNPMCDFVVTPEGKYGMYDSLTEVAPVNVVQEDLGNGTGLGNGVFVINDTAGDPMYMFLSFPTVGTKFYPGEDTIVRTLEEE